MNFSLKESYISEIFRLLTINIDKVNYLSFSLSKSNYNNVKVNQFLSEFQYDLKQIYDILKQIQYESDYQNENEQFKQEKRKNIYLNLSDRTNRHYSLNNLEESNKNNNEGKKNKENKKYNLTINILSDKCYDYKKKMKKKFNKSCSCKLYKKKKLSKNLIKNLKKMTLRENLFSDRIKENIINENKLITYLTDYSTKNKNNDSYNNKLRANINKNKASLKHLNSLYKIYDDFLLKNNNFIKKYTKFDYNKIINQNKSNLHNNINDANNYHSYNPHYNYENNILEENNKQNEINYKDSYDDFIKDYEKKNNYMKETMTKKIISQILQDSNKLKEIKKNFGNDVCLKLLDGVLDNKQINNIFDFLEKYEHINDKNIFRGSKYNYRNYKYEYNDNKNDLLLFSDNKYHKYKKEISNDDYNFNYDKIPLSN